MLALLGQSIIIVYCPKLKVDMLGTLDFIRTMKKC
ncbi:hypothetical protein FITA111629_11070 [Filibacter tadaridae]|uniref:Uncharacterized protein n=1 Tax=Filibacter tadaridae TaxID=2483811 RepID=A0A3P5X142_9BACL|nr:hypothetical protein FILTAD_01142 [Filibacter tadaridae]